MLSWGKWNHLIISNRKPWDSTVLGFVADNQFPSHKEVSHKSLESAW